jgi:hypothetical protein
MCVRRLENNVVEHLFILSRDKSVTRDGVWIGSAIDWTFKQLLTTLYESLLHTHIH